MKFTSRQTDKFLFEIFTFSENPFISNLREAYRDDMASVCKLIIKTCDMACEKRSPTCSGAFWSKWVYDSTYSRATALTSNVLARLVVCVGLDKGGYPRGKAWEIFAYFASGQSKYPASRNPIISLAGLWEPGRPETP